MKVTTRPGRKVTSPEKKKATIRTPGRPKVSKVEIPKCGGRPRGHPKTGGRKSGTPNKRTFDAVTKLEDLACDPLEVLAALARNKSAPLRLRACAELMQYIYPKRKAVEFVPAPDTGIVTVTLEQLLLSYRQASK